MKERSGARLSGMLALMLLAGVVTLLGFLSPVENYGLPQCAFRRATGWSCPGCGGTRALHAALNGRLASSISYNLLAIPLALLGGYPLLRMGAKGLFAWRWPPLPRKKAFWVGLAAAVVGFGILRNLPWSPFPPMD